MTGVVTSEYNLCATFSQAPRAIAAAPTVSVGGQPSPSQDRALGDCDPWTELFTQCTLVGVSPYCTAPTPLAPYAKGDSALARIVRGEYPGRTPIRPARHKELRWYVAETAYWSYAVALNTRAKQYWHHARRQHDERIRQLGLELVSGRLQPRSASSSAAGGSL